MEDKKTFETKTNNSRITLFRFELSPTQKILFLILSLIGVLFLPFMLAGDIFLNLFQSIFDSLPAYLSNPEIYHEDYLFNNFAPVITNIIIYSIFFCLSIYALKKLIKTKENSNEQKRNIILQDRIVNWLGFKISHGQSLFIFSVSLAGVLFIVQEYIYSYNPFFMGGVFESLCWIPVGPTYQAASHNLLLNNVPLAINATFFTLCLYSIIASRRGKPRSSGNKIAKNQSLIIFIIFFIVFLFSFIRVLCHLFLFTDLAYTLGITPNVTNSYQTNDFIRVIVILFISLTLMITSYFMKENSQEVVKKDIKLSWINIELTPHRALILLSVAILYIIFFTVIYLVTAFLLKIINFTSITYNSILFHGIFVGIIIFCYYPIGKISKNHRLVTIVENIENSGEYETNWFKFRLNKLYSVIFLSVSCGLIPLFVFQLLLMNMNAQAFLSDFMSFNSYLLFSFPLMTAVIIIILVVNIYTIKKTIHSIKSNPSKN